MRDLNKKIEKYHCTWLRGYLKELIMKRDLKNYNRVKCVVYYYPEILNGVTDASDFKISFDHADDTYICLGSNDKRYSIFDNIYKRTYGKDFEPPQWGEVRYITIGEFCKYFKV